MATDRTETYTDGNGREKKVRVIVCRNRGCGREVWCYDFTNTCDCGLDYNWSGQQLAPRSHWGEETGESAADILQAEAAGFPERDDYY